MRTLQLQLSLIFIFQFISASSYTQATRVPVAVHFENAVFDANCDDPNYTYPITACRTNARFLVYDALRELNLVFAPFNFSDPSNWTPEETSCQHDWWERSGGPSRGNLNIEFKLPSYNLPSVSPVQTDNITITYGEFESEFQQYHSNKQFTFGGNSKWVGYLNIWVGRDTLDPSIRSIMPIYVPNNSPDFANASGVYISSDVFGGNQMGSYSYPNINDLGDHATKWERYKNGGAIAQAVARYLGLEYIMGRIAYSQNHPEKAALGACLDPNDPNQVVDDGLHDTPLQKEDYFGYNSIDDVRRRHYRVSPNSCHDPSYSASSGDAPDLWWNVMSHITDTLWYCGFTEDQCDFLNSAATDYWQAYGDQEEIYSNISLNVETAYEIYDNTLIFFQNLSEFVSGDLQRNIKKSNTSVQDSMLTYWLFDGAGVNVTSSKELDPIVMVSHTGVLSTTLRISYGSEFADTTFYIPIEVPEQDIADNEYIDKLIPNNLPSEDYSRMEFGHAVAIEDSVIIVGAPGADDDRGAAFIYRKINDEWTEEALLQPTDLLEDEEFGYSVDVFGNYVAVGAPCINCTHGAWESFGRVYVYEYDGVDWNLIHDLPYGNSESVDMLIGLEENSQFGYKVKFYDDYLIVGDPMGAEENNMEDFYGAGTLIFFDMDDIGKPANLFYSHTQTSQPYLIDRLDRIGSDFEYVDGNIIVSAPEAEIHYLGEFQDSYVDVNSYYVDEDEGLIFIYPCGATASDCRMLVNDVSSIGDSISVKSYRGASLSAYGEWMAASIKIDYIPGEEDGVEFYRQESSGQYVLDTTIYGKEDEKFGTDIFFLNENYILISAEEGETHEENESGLVYLYQNDGSEWSLLQTVDPGVLNDNDKYGHSIEMTSSHIVVGAPQDDSKGLNSGAVYIHLTDRLHCDHTLNLSGQMLSNRTEELYARTINVIGEITNASISLTASEELNLFESFKIGEQCTFESSIGECPSIPLQD